MNRLCTVVGAAALGISSGFVGFAPGFLGSGPGVANAASHALIVGGKGGYAHLTDEQISDAFGGYFAGYDDRISVDFPGSNNFKASVQTGATNLYNDVQALTNPENTNPNPLNLQYDPEYFITIGGVSEGAPSVTNVLQQLQTDFDNGLAVPDPDQLNAAVYGYPSKALRLGTKYQPFPDTQYDLLYVFAQYDGVADFPDNPFNLLAVTNAIMGGEQLHVDAANYPILTQSTYYSQTTGSNGGTTTIVMIPTPVLPLLQPMLDAGADPAKVAALDAKLRPKIDRAYKRPQFQQGVIAPGVVDYPPGYTPPPPPATTSATTAAATIPAADVAATSVDASSPASAPVGAPRTTDQAINKLLAENATASTQPLDVPASNVVAAPAVSATTTEQPTADEQNGSENSSVAASSQPATNSSDASANDAGSQNGSTSGTSHVKSRATKAGSSASSGTHSTSRKLGHRN